MTISLVVAMAENRVIGRDNQLPWRLPADLRHFKQITLGKPVVMGRKTYESIGRPLPKRTNIVVTRDKNYQAPGCTVVNSICEAFTAAIAAEEIMIIGGANFYEQLLSHADRIYLTVIHQDFEGDTYFPPLVENDWKETGREDHEADAENSYAYSFLVLERK